MFFDLSGRNRLTRFIAIGEMLPLLAACNEDSLFDKGAPANNGAQVAESGYYLLESSGMEREYYLQVPSNYDPDGEPLPLLIAIHGSGDSIEGWMAGGFQGDGLLKLTRDKAIMVIPNGLK